MKIPGQINTYCKHCNKKTTFKVLKVIKKGKPSPFSFGERHHKKELKGYHGKVHGIKPVVKRGKKQKILMECTECKKKIEKIIGSRTSKALEIAKVV
ncbi:MAG: 50S ribosomal protein L44e [Candidatus Micrarchaeia archaeon]